MVVLEDNRMSKAKRLSEDPGCLQLLEAKIHARNKQVAAVYAASPAELERAAVLIKAAWLREIWLNTPPTSSKIAQ